MNLKGIEKIPIIFSEHYDIALLGLEKLHPFDTQKYGKVYNYLVEKAGIAKDRFYTPEPVFKKELLSVHTPEYLSSLKKSKNIAKIAELEILSLIPNTLLQKHLLQPMRYATGGTVLGCQLALKYGWAINLSGGYHHAKRDSGGGFCFFADIPIALYKVFEEKKNLKALIIDLDAHQGNGCEAILGDDPRVHILDVYNEEIYPWDFEARKYIDFDYPVKSYIEDKEYLKIVEKGIKKAMTKLKPGLIIYNAGTDILEGDPLGCMSISENGIIKRDEVVFKYALENRIPILMVLSGGYTHKSAEIIGKSIENIFKKCLKKFL